MQLESLTQTPASALYARVWRWHFWAAFLVVPFVLWQAVTGVTYLWHREISMAMHPELLRVAPHATTVSFEAQLQAAIAANRGAHPSQIVIEDDASYSTAFYFTAANQLAYPTFVDPQSGRVLGSVAPLRWMEGLTRSLHGGWPLGHWGSNLLELCAGWAIVMIVTGLYLWWPRSPGLAGVLYPRLHAGPKVFWRDLHATVGAWYALVVLAFLFTALPWTSFWGGTVLGAVERLTHQSSPSAAFFSGGDGHAGHASTNGSHQGSARATLDQVIGRARSNGLKGRLEIRPNEAGAIQVRSQTGRSPFDIYLQLDRKNAEVIERSTWAETDTIPRLVALGVDLHQGTYFGRWNQWFNSLVAASLVWMSVTGIMGWYRRRPGRGLSPPRRVPRRMPKLIVLAAATLGVTMPLLGASMVMVLLIDAVLPIAIKK
ncbi:MAG: PepSY domain-containing protein [Pseudomonadota bacterium]